MNPKLPRILAAAKARFNHYGIQKTSMQEIAADADVAVGTLYRYFKNKDDLILACAEQFISHHQQLADEILASSLSPPEKLRKYVLSRYRECKEVSTSSRHAADLARAVIRLKPNRLEEEGKLMHEMIALIVEEGRRAKAFHCKDIPRAATVLLYSIAYFFPNALMNLPHWPKEDALRLVLDWFLETWQSKK